LTVWLNYGETQLGDDVMNGLTAADMFENGHLKKLHIPIQLRQSGDNGDEGLRGAAFWSTPCYTKVPSNT